MQRWWIAAVLLAASVVSAQDLPDASLPDASVGGGGADHSSEENDPAGPCLDSRDCDFGFACQGGRCVPGGTRHASGCGGQGLLAVSLAGGVLGVWGVRRRQAAGARGKSDSSTTA